MGLPTRPQPRLLDLFAGAGGATRGYQLAGFHVTGVDNRPQPRYCGDAFYEADAMTFPLEGFDAVHASPPCQAYSTLGRFSKHVTYPDLYEPTRARLEAAGVPWVIENVVGAPYRSGFVLCGSMFGLRVRRHRNFESSELMFPPLCDHREQGHPTGVYGHGQFFWKDGEKSWRNVPIDEARDAMGIGWMERRELAEAIPPAYTQFIGEQLLGSVRRVA
jgi:DNA (cytosine-5)-methyltransferase 1